MKKTEVIVISFLFYLLSFFLVACGLHSIDISQNMNRLNAYNLKNAVVNTINSGVPLTAVIWNQDMTAFGNVKDDVGIYMMGIWLVVFGAVLNLLAYFTLLQLKINKVIR